MDHLQYLALLAGCLAVTLPLELAGARVYRRPRRLARAVVPVAAVFLVWDALAIAGGVWGYGSRYVTGLTLPFAVPLEEALFFLVVPVCGLLTFEGVRLTLEFLRRPAFSWPCRAHRRPAGGGREDAA